MKRKRNQWKQELAKKPSKAQLRATDALYRPKSAMSAPREDTTNFYDELYQDWLDSEH